MKNKEDFPEVNEVGPLGTDTNAALNASLAELDRLKSEEHKLELEERRLNVELKREEVAKKQQARATRLAQLEAAATQIQAQLRANKALQEHCTHMKGGVVVQGNASVVMNGQGTDNSDYCIIRHVLPAGNLMLLCQRCLQEEHGPNPLTGEPATAGYEKFKRFPTKNHTSGSSQFFAANRYSREVIA